jgi:hypothetical protein
MDGTEGQGDAPVVEVNVTETPPEPPLETTGAEPSATEVAVAIIEGQAAIATQQAAGIAVDAMEAAESAVEQVEEIATETRDEMTWLRETVAAQGENLRELASRVENLLTPPPSSEEILEALPEAVEVTTETITLETPMEASSEIETEAPAKSEEERRDRPERRRKHRLI